MLPAAQRFVVLAAFNNEAVLDKETGLVWERSPGNTTHTWSDARAQCTQRIIGPRRAWRLPAVHELASLLDPFVAALPQLPSGHPFLTAQAAIYWSASADQDISTGVWVGSFITAEVFGDVKTSSHQVWCVRGGMNADQY